MLERVLRFSEQCLELGDYDSALEVLVLVIEVTSDEPRIAKIRLLMSRAYKLKGSIEDARAILITAPLENLHWLTRETIYLLLAEMAALRGRGHTIQCSTEGSGLWTSGNRWTYVKLCMVRPLPRGTVCSNPRGANQSPESGIPFYSGPGLKLLFICG